MNTKKKSPEKKNKREHVKKANTKTQKKEEEQVESVKPGKLSTFFNHFSANVTRITGSVYTFITAIALIVIWVVTGPLFNFSDTWQLVINTGTTIITFLMVFIIQHSQNKDTVALQLKLNELIKVSKGSNKLISVEDLTDEELALMKKFYEHLSVLSKDERKDEVEKIEEVEDEKEEIIEQEKSSRKHKETKTK